ncbi:MAG TPA: UbiA family prenyltransferase, partial [Planctomycetota bacterium]|nr:UbiA family prenyltransferase [Planctomycetota bacterium]
VLAPLVFAGRLFDPASLRPALLVTLALCLLSSSGYVLNDLHDAPADRHHPDKRLRPLARGALRPGSAWAAAALCAAAGLLLARFVQLRVPAPAPHGLGALGPFDLGVAYLLLTLAYTLLLKRVLVLDVVVLALGFVVRTCAGSAALALLPSRWLLLCGFSLALFLAFGKRCLELRQLRAGTALTRPMFAAYPLPLAERLLDVSSWLCTGSYVAYAVAPGTVAHVGSRALLVTTPVVALLVERHRRRVRSGIGSDPVRMLLTDPVSVGGFLLWTAAVLAVIYRPW